MLVVVFPCGAEVVVVVGGVVVVVVVVVGVDNDLLLELVLVA